MKNKIYSLLTILIFLKIPLIANTIDFPKNKNHIFNQSINKFQYSITNKGFENVRIQIGKNKTVLIEYENRRYRYEIKALKIILQDIAKFLSPFETYIIIPLNRNIPLVKITIKAIDYQNFIDGMITSDEFLQNISIKKNFYSNKKTLSYSTQRLNLSFQKYDFILNPGFKAQFSRPNDPAQLQFNFLPTINTTLASGLSFKSQIIIPLYNEFINTESSSRIGTTVLNKFIRCPNNIYTSFSIGHFNQQRNGFSTEWGKFFYDDRFAFFTKLDYTTLSNKWNSSYNLNYLLKAKYYFPNVDFAFDICWGRYLFNDETWRVDVCRSFEEIDLGFMLIGNKNIEVLFGMIINIPFPISTRPLPKKFRISSPVNVPWNYRYLPYFDGFILDTETDIESYFKKLHPTFIKNNIQKLKD